MRSLLIGTAHSSFLGEKIRKNEMVRECDKYGEGGGVVYVVMVSKPEGKRPLGRHRRR